MQWSITGSTTRKGAHGQAGQLHHQKGITNMFLTPTQLNLQRPEDVGCLKFLFVGGEPLTQKLIDIWAPHLTLAEGYGMSEGVSMRNTIDKSGKKSRSLQTIRGHAWIVDSDDTDTLMPIGATGELLFEGPSLFKGYRNNPDANAKSRAFSLDWVKKLLDYFVDVYQQLPNMLAHQSEEKLPSFILALPQDDTVTSQQLNGKISLPSIDYRADLEAKVLSYWESVFGIDFGSDAKFSHNTSFYDTWGNATAGPALAHEYTKNGLLVTCEEVYEYPSMHQTIAHLSRRMNGVAK